MCGDDVLKLVLKRYVLVFTRIADQILGPRLEGRVQCLCLQSNVQLAHAGLIPLHNSGNLRIRRASDHHG